MRFAFFPFRSSLTSVLTVALVAGISAGSAPSAHAAITIFTDQALFEAAFPNLATGSFLDTFTGGDGLYVDYFASGNGFSYGAAQSGPNPQFTFRTGNVIQANSGGQSLIFTSLGGNYNAIGGNFFQSDFSGALLALPVTVTVSNGTDTVTETYTPTSATLGSFRGFVSTVPLSTLTITEATADRRFSAADNLRVGTAVAPLSAAAPEPGSLALLLPVLPVLGTVGIVIRRKRKGSAN